MYWVNIRLLFGLCLGSLYLGVFSLFVGVYWVFYWVFWVVFLVGSVGVFLGCKGCYDVGFCYWFGVGLICCVVGGLLGLFWVFVWWWFFFMCFLWLFFFLVKSLVFSWFIISVYFPIRKSFLISKCFFFAY